MAVTIYSNLFGENGKIDINAISTYSGYKAVEGVDDPNDLAFSEYAWILTDHENGPRIGQFWFINTIKYSITRYFQIAYGYTVNEIWYRRRFDNIFSEWIPLYFDTGWYNIPLQNGWEQYPTEAPPQFRKIGNQVYLRGLIRNGTALTIGSLPGGYRPIYNYYGSTIQNSKSVEIIVNQQGIIYLRGGAAITQWVSLNNITFLAD